MSIFGAQYQRGISNEGRSRLSCNYASSAFQLAGKGWKSCRCNLDVDKIRLAVLGSYFHEPASDGAALSEAKT